jgi:hypothetical protein
MTLLGKTQITCFYQAIWIMMSFQNKLSFIDSKPNNAKHPQKKLLMSPTLFKFYANPNKSMPILTQLMPQYVTSTK